MIGRGPESSPPSPDVLELYKMSVEMADRVSARRGQANQFYLTLQSSLLGIPAAFGLIGGDELDPLTATLLAVVGGMTSVTWWLQLRSYRDLNRAKFDVINQIENKYFTVRPFSDEWASLKKDPVPRWRARYAELGMVERIVPVVFLSVNLIVAITVWI
jgi:hypothetical protein